MTHQTRYLGEALRARAQACEAMVVYDKASKVKGFFAADDALHFSLALGMQQALGMRGDILEIGSWFGRSTGFLASFVRDGERLVVCDAFEAETQDRYPDRPTEAILRANIAHVVPGFEPSRLVIHNCLSKDLRLADDEKFRCIHVDGGHQHDEALHDLMLAADHLLPGGVLIVDDYRHASWPGVTTAVAAFLHERPDIAMAASMNRWVAIGQKLYLIKAPIVN